MTTVSVCGWMTWKLADQLGFGRARRSADAAMSIVSASASLMGSNRVAFCPDWLTVRTLEMRRDGIATSPPNARPLTARAWTARVCRLVPGCPHGSADARAATRPRRLRSRLLRRPVRASLSRLLTPFALRLRGRLRPVTSREGTGESGTADLAKLCLLSKPSCACFQPTVKTAGGSSAHLVPQVAPFIWRCGGRALIAWLKRPMVARWDRWSADPRVWLSDPDADGSHGRGLGPRRRAQLCLGDEQPAKSRAALLLGKERHDRRAEFGARSVAVCWKRDSELGPGVLWEVGGVTATANHAG